MGLVGIDHIQLAIPKGGEDTARGFFVGLLGMREVPKPANLSNQGCWFESEGVRLHLGVDPDFVPARKAHPAFIVSDASALRDQLTQAGVEVKDEAPIEGYQRFFTQDPFGNRIELMQRLKSYPVVSEG